MPQRERQVNINPRCEHALQLFDSRESLAGAVASFLREGLTAGDRLLAVMTPENWEASSRRLRRHGLDPTEPIASGQLKILDAAATLRTFMRDGTPDRDLFDVSVGALVRELSAHGTLRIYGEMVDLLAEQGAFRGALQLEGLWNELREREPFTLFCGYSAVSFGDPQSAAMLQLTCHAHSQIRTNPRDLLAKFLLEAPAR